MSEYLLKYYGNQTYSLISRSTHYQPYTEMAVDSRLLYLNFIVYTKKLAAISSNYQLCVKLFFYPKICPLCVKKTCLDYFNLVKVTFCQIKCKNAIFTQFFHSVMLELASSSLKKPKFVKKLVKVAFSHFVR